MGELTLDNMNGNGGNEDYSDYKGRWEKGKDKAIARIEDAVSDLEELKGNVESASWESTDSDLGSKLQNWASDIEDALQEMYDNDKEMAETASDVEKEDKKRRSKTDESEEHVEETRRREYDSNLAEQDAKEDNEGW
ncbi:MAG: hypothetical protein ABSD73_12350 [Candidatus Bathyarchaeia archaeon]|jgi:septation ring formation regulator EzrA